MFELVITVLLASLTGYGACVFHTKLDTDSRRNWTVIPRQTGHRFQSKLDSHL